MPILREKPRIGYVENKGLVMPETNREQLYAIIYETVRKIPKGKVATYGQIARLIGLTQTC